MSHNSRKYDNFSNQSDMEAKATKQAPKRQKTVTFNAKLEECKEDEKIQEDEKNAEEEEEEESESDIEDKRFKVLENRRKLIQAASTNSKKKLKAEKNTKKRNIKKSDRQSNQNIKRKIEDYMHDDDDDDTNTQYSDADDQDNFEQDFEIDKIPDSEYKKRPEPYSKTRLGRLNEVDEMILTIKMGQDCREWESFIRRKNTTDLDTNLLPILHTKDK